jgi:hypothetical protein
MKVLIISAIIAILAFATLSSSLTIKRDNIAAIRKSNADDAEALQEKFASFTPNTKCEPGEMACINKAFATCAAVLENGEIVNKYQLFPCGVTLECFALPLVLKRGTSLTCSKYQKS